MHPRKVNTARKIKVSRLRGPIVATPTEREVEPSPISGGSPDIVHLPCIGPLRALTNEVETPQFMLPLPTLAGIDVGDVALDAPGTTVHTCLRIILWAPVDGASPAAAPVAASDCGAIIVFWSGLGASVGLGVTLGLGATVGSGRED